MNYTEVGPAVAAPDSVVFLAVSNLQDEINGLSMQIDQLCSRLGAASRPSAPQPVSDSMKEAQPITSLLTKKVDDQARRVRVLSNQIATALEGLEL